MNGRWLRIWNALPQTERRLLGRALSVVLTVRLQLWLRPRAAARMISHEPLLMPCLKPISPERIAWAVHAASRLVPGATCLTQALSGRRLLARSGYPAQIVLGVAKDGAALRAHAWLECDGKRLLGGPADGAFTRLPALERERPQN